MSVGGFAAPARRVITRATGEAPSGTRRGGIERFALVSMAASFVAQFALRPSGPGNSSPVDVLVLVSILATAIWASSTRLPLRAPYVLGVALMVIGGAIAGVTGPMPGTAPETLAIDLLLITWCTTIVAVARSPRSLTVLVRAWAYSAVACAGLLVLGSLAGITAITGVRAREGNREMFAFGDPNYAATYWVLSIFVVHACRAPRSWPLRLCSYALLVWALLLSESNGGVVELAVGCGAIFLLSVLRRYGPAAAIALLLIVGGSAAMTLQLVPFSSMQTWARGSNNALLVNSLGRSKDSSGQRSLLVTEAMALYSSDGWLGSGPATTKPLLQNRSYAYAKETHDDYLAALVERGPLGVLGLMFFVASAGWRGGQLVRAAHNGPEDGVLPRPAGLVAAMLATSVAATYYEVLHFRFIWALLALVAAYAWQCTEARSPRAAGKGSRA